MTPLFISAWRTETKFPSEGSWWWWCKTERLMVPDRERPNEDNVIQLSWTLKKSSALNPYSFVSSKVKSFAKLKGGAQFALKGKYAKLIKRMLGVWLHSRVVSEWPESLPLRCAAEWKSRRKNPTLHCLLFSAGAFFLQTSKYKRDAIFWRIMKRQNIVVGCWKQLANTNLF